MVCCIFLVALPLQDLCVSTNHLMHLLLDFSFFNLCFMGKFYFIIQDLGTTGKDSFNNLSGKYKMVCILFEILLFLLFVLVLFHY